MNDPQKLIDETAAFAKERLTVAEAGHDWWHTCRVWQTARHIGQQENVNMLVVELAALLHDIADAKFHDGDENIGPATAYDFLSQKGVDENTIQQVVNIIKHMSFKNSFDAVTYSSQELCVLQDADRLDAIGAIGIARAFSYGGFRGRIFYDPDIPPITGMTKEQYKQSTAPTINHFYEKLLLLKDRMHTRTGRAMAEDRHTFMEYFLSQFFQEWSGEK